MDWNDLQRLTADGLHIYEALRRAERLSEEGERLLKEAEDLLRRAALTYLLEPLPPEYLPDSGAPPTVAMAEAWAQLQVAWADLKGALYQLAQTRLESDDLSVLITLVETDQSYRDVAALLKEKSLSIARGYFGEGKWDEGRAVLKRASKAHPDREIRLELLRSFVNQVIKSVQEEDMYLSLVDYWLKYDKKPLESLLCEEPAVAGLSSFQRAVSSPSWVSQSRRHYKEDETKEVLRELLSELAKVIAVQ